ADDVARGFLVTDEPGRPRRVQSRAPPVGRRVAGRHRERRSGRHPRDRGGGVWRVAHDVHRRPRGQVGSVTMGDLVLIDHPADHVARVTLNRPERLNAMSIDLVIELWHALEEVAAENDTWVVVLTGAGTAFSSGLDLKDYGIIP